MDHVKNKVDEAFRVALKLGMGKASDVEKEIFKELLFQIAGAANDEIRKSIDDELFKYNIKYSNGMSVK